MKRPNLLPVNFNKRQSYRTVHPKFPGLYIDPRTGNYYERPSVDDPRTGKKRQTFRKLQSNSARHAYAELVSNRSNQSLARIGRAEDPYARNSQFNIAAICKMFIAAGCPKRNGTERAGQPLKTETQHIVTLLEWWGDFIPDKLTLEDCKDYHTWRIQRTKGEGHRQTDKELVTLSGILRWAMRNTRKTGVKTNPIAIERDRFQKAENVHHCREFQPESGDELHTLAAEFFKEPRSEVLGWQLLFEAMCGQRTHEILQLRTDAAKPYQAGYIQGALTEKIIARLPELPDHKAIGTAPILFLTNSDTHKGTYPYIQIHRALGETILAFQTWHHTRFPQSPFYFPSPEFPNKQPAGNGALSRALPRITKRLGLPQRTSHGLRSYFVNVLRSHGRPDYEIALMIGQSTGGKLIPDVYGMIPTKKLHWTPKT